MRVTFNAIHREATAGLQRANQRLLEWQRQVSTGRRLGKVSDDPSAAAAAIVERGERAAIAQYTQSSDSAASRLQVVDVVLGDIVDKLSAAQSAALSARGTTVTIAQREAAAAALEGLRDAVLSDINTSFRGTYLFAGAAATEPPYTRDASGTVSAYRGSTVTVETEVARGQTVTTGYNGETIARGAAVDDVFVTFSRTIAAARAGDDAALSAGVQELAAAFDRAVQAQSAVGASLREIEDGKLRLSQAARSVDQRVSALEEANMATAITGMTQAEAAYRAALGAASAVDRESLMDYLK